MAEECKLNDIAKCILRVLYMMKEAPSKNAWFERAKELCGIGSKETFMKWVRHLEKCGYIECSTENPRLGITCKPKLLREVIEIYRRALEEHTSMFNALPPELLHAVVSFEIIRILFSLVDVLVMHIVGIAEEDKMVLYSLLECNINFTIQEISRVIDERVPRLTYKDKHYVVEYLVELVRSFSRIVINSLVKDRKTRKRLHSIVDEIADGIKHRSQCILQGGVPKPIKLGEDNAGNVIYVIKCVKRD